MYTIDFETEAIDFGSGKSPTPVGVAVKHLDRPSQYHAWGHPTENNSTFEKGRKILTDIWNSDEPLLFHNAKFDVSVAMDHFSLPYPVGRVHDTMFLAYLNNARERTLALKPLSEKYLGIPPDEQDEVKDWILAHVPKATKKTYGAFICEAPGELVGRYAVGDVDRTYALYCYFMGIIEEL